MATGNEGPLNSFQHVGNVIRFKEFSWSVARVEAGGLQSPAWSEPRRRGRLLGDLRGRAWERRGGTAPGPAWARRGWIVGSLTRTGWDSREGLCGRQFSVGLPEPHWVRSHTYCSLSLWSALPPLLSAPLEASSRLPIVVIPGTSVGAFQALPSAFRGLP